MASASGSTRSTTVWTRPVGDQGDRTLQLVERDVARSDELDLLEHEPGAREHDVLLDAVADADDSAAGPHEAERLRERRLGADRVDDDIDALAAGEDPLLALGIAGLIGGEVKLFRDLEGAP